MTVDGMETDFPSDWVPFKDPRQDAKILTKALGQKDIPEFIEALSNLTELVLACLSEWTSLLRPYFEDSQRESLPPTILARRQIERRQPNFNTMDEDSLAIWENDAIWKENHNVKRAIIRFLTLLPSASIIKFEDATKLIPFIIHMAEDSVPQHRHHGVIAIRNFIRVVQSKLILQMQLDDLFSKILLLNQSFDLVELKKDSLETFINDLCELSGLKFEKKLDNLEELVEFLIHQISAAQEDELILLYLNSLINAGQGLSFALIGQLKKLLMLVFDLLNDRHSPHLNEAIIKLLKVIIDHCWPRLATHKVLLQQILLNIPETEFELVNRINEFLS